MTEIDPDRVDGRGIVAWLIHTGAGMFVGSAPYSMWLTVDIILNPRNNDVEDAMLEGMQPMLTVLPTAAVAAVVIVLAARAGRPLGLLPLLALGAALGAGVAALVFEGAAVALAFGLISGLMAGGAIWKVRSEVLST